MRSVITAAVGVTIAVVFFPVWFSVPVAFGFGVWGLGMAAFGGSVVVDPETGVLVMRMGLITRRVRLDNVRAVLVEQAKVSVARTKGGEISLYAWRRDRLDGLLRVPVEAADIGHAIAGAVALAQHDASAAGAASGSGANAGGASGSGTNGGGAANGGGTRARTRSRLATALLAGAGALAIVGALVVRVHWDNPALTVIGVIIALVLGVSGLFYLLVALWILLTGRAPRATVP
jgi:hypothetical protein